MAPEGAYEVTSAPYVKMEDMVADGLLDTCLGSLVGAGRDVGQSQDPVEGSQGSGLVVQWGVLDSIPAYYSGVKAETGGWRWELKESSRGEI